MDADGKNQTLLGGDGGWHWKLSWSPDGQRIATTGNGGIYVIDADGKNQTRLTVTDFGAGPDWSPDGQRIAFHSPRDENHVASDIYVMDADGKNRTRLTDLPVDEWTAVWSPDGQRIAFTSHHDGYDGELYVVDADGKNQTQLTDFSANAVYTSWTVYHPEWSSDGQRIAFESYRDGYGWAIYVVDADGKNLTQLTDNSFNAWGAAWSPAGQRIAFTSARDGDYHIYVIYLD